MSAAKPTVIESVRRALGRSGPLTAPPVPPPLDEPTVRLVFSAIGLPELFARRAREMKMLVEPVAIDSLVDRIAGFLKERNCRRIMLSDTLLIERLGLVKALNDAGMEARSWRHITADQSYDFDAGVTEVDYAVAETGTLAIRHSPQNGRLLSLAPMVHVAIVEPRHLLPDLLDLFEILGNQGIGSGVTLISGPSKTADIEMITITGVHGPLVVMAFVLS